MSDTHALDALYATIAARAGADPGQSYTAQLLAAGPARITAKLTEECAETVAEALAGDNPRLVAESADLLYHLLVLWAARGVTPDEIWAALAARGPGLQEKAARNKGRDA